MSKSWIIVAFLVTATAYPASAERWQKAGSVPRNPSFPNINPEICVDLDSVKTDASGFTLYRARNCEDKSSYVTEYRVKCTQNFAGEKFTLGEKIGARWHTDQSYSSALVGLAAKFVCHK